MDILLKKTEIKDLETLYHFQNDEIAKQMAAFTPKDTADKKAYLERWSNLITKESCFMQTIWQDDQILGSVVSYKMEGEPQVSYWIDRPHWGKKIATKALMIFLGLYPERPIFGRVAYNNYGSKKVLENCGFQKIGVDQFFANARGKEIEEWIYRLDS